MAAYETPIVKSLKATIGSQTVCIRNQARGGPEEHVLGNIGLQKDWIGGCCRGSMAGRLPELEPWERKAG